MRDVSTQLLRFWRREGVVKRGGVEMKEEEFAIV
jgi:hypothetical protein